MIFTKLILAHFLGDFLLQPTVWVSDKEKHKAASPYLYLHILIHFVLAILLLGDLQLIWVAAVIAISHLIIDWVKLQFQTEKDKKKWFFLDQILHFSVIAAVSYYFNEFDAVFFSNPIFLKYITAAVFLTLPASLMIKMLITSWTPVTADKNAVQTESLANAGKYIGILERLMVFVFIAVNHWEGVGFMVAAKSVFRFSDLAQAKQRKLTEYVLIGTLLSFGTAILTGILIKI